MGTLLLAINVAVLLIVWMLTVSTGVDGFPPAAARALGFANLTGLLAFILLRRAPHEALRRLPSTPVAAAGLAGVTVAGCCVSQVLVLLIGLEQGESFWSGLLRTLSVALPVALVFGLGALFQSSLQLRIRHLEAGLKVQEMAAEENRKLAVEARLRSLEARIHPHFLFNTLNSISSLIVSDPGGAERALGRLTALLRGALDNRPQSSITLREEIALVESYLEIERIRFGDKLRWSLKAHPDTLETHVPRMAVLSLAENSVKHGVAARGGGAVDVWIFTAAGQVRIEVRDTGPGFDLSAVQPGHGLDSIVSRLDAQFGARAFLNIERREGYAVVELVVPRS